MNRIPHLRSQPWRQTAGITLIEMLIVIVMIGILAGIAVSKLDFVRYRADSVGRGVLSDISAAQRTAVSLQTDVRITVDPAGDRLRIHEDANNNGSIDGSERVIYSALENGFKVGKGTMTGTPAPADPADLTNVTLVFRRDGTASQGGTYYISSSTADSACRYCRAVSVSRATGRTVAFSYATGTWVRGN